MAEEKNGGRGGGINSGLELAAGIGLGVVVGYWIDHKFNTGPRGVIIGFFVGFGVGMYLLIKDAIKSNKD